jgi:hypothetical protein
MLYRALNLPILSLKMMEKRVHHGFSVTAGTWPTGRPPHAEPKE